MALGHKRNAGFSLVESIVAMAILTMVYMAVFKIFSNQKFAVARVELTTKAIFLSQELMNRVVAKNYDENSEPPWTPTASLGLEGDDVFYDDVDDFAGYSNSSISNFPGFTETARVFYVSSSGSLDDSIFTATDFKKIVVTVTHNEIPPIVLDALISSHY
ncbi:MAG: type II secretion system protein [Candidatus Marinimicrobia bacterium]|nr:type II secretion system protein [Candidatus Neomarinimicrobiota bacterium]